MNADMIVMYDLGKDALTYTQRSIVGLDPMTPAASRSSENAYCEGCVTCQD